MHLFSGFDVFIGDAIAYRESLRHSWEWSVSPKNEGRGMQGDVASHRGAAFKHLGAAVCHMDATYRRTGHHSNHCCPTRRAERCEGRSRNPPSAQCTM